MQEVNFGNMAGSRTYVDDTVMKACYLNKWEKRRVFLFSDTVILAQVLKKNRYVMKLCLPLDRCLVWNIVDGTNVGGKPSPDPSLPLAQSCETKTSSLKQQRCGAEQERQ